MSAAGVALMVAAVWAIVTAPDLSGTTILGALAFLVGMRTVHVAQDRRARRVTHRDSTATALHAEAERMVPHV